MILGMRFSCLTNKASCYKFTHPYFAWSLLASSLFISTSVLAQSAPNAGALQRELDLQLQRELTVPQTQPVKPERKPDVDTSGEKVTLAGFKFEGNTLFNSAELNTVIAPWLNKPLSFQELTEITAAIQDFYSANGRIAQASFPPQDIENGVVLISILEGRLGKVDVESAEGKVRFSLEEAKKYISKDPGSNELIDTKPLEKGLLLLNELPGLSATGVFEPGEAPGTSDFKVRLSETPFFSGQVGLSNYGASSTGVGQAVGSLSMNNISGIGDQINLNVIESLGSNYAVASYNRPLGTDGLRFGAQASYLNYETLSSWSDIQTRGTANSFSAFLNYPLLRTLRSSSNVKFNIEQRNYNNLQAGNTVSNYQVNAGSLGINGNTFLNERSSLTYGLSYTLGQLNINDLTQAGQDLGGPGTAGTYSKINFNVVNRRDLVSLPGATWTNSLYGQLANKNLNSSEQIYMGGPYGVRAYPVTQGGGSQGAILSSDLVYKIDENWQVGGFFDVGVVQQFVNTYPGWQGATNANNLYLLGDVGLSAKFIYKNMMLDLSLAYRVGDNPLYNSTGQQLNADNTYKSLQVWVRQSFTF